MNIGHNFASNLVDRQTNRQTNKPTKVKTLPFWKHCLFLFGHNEFVILSIVRSLELSVHYLQLINKKLIRRWDSQMWLDDIGGDMPDSPVWLPPSCLFGYLRGVAQPHAVREICSEGWSPGRSSWFLVGELPDGQGTILCKISPKS